MGLDSSEREAPQLTPDEWREKAKTILLNRLSRGPRSKLQLAQLLAKREVPEEFALEILERFEEVGLIDDKSFAQAFSHDRRSSRGLAKRALARELNGLGVNQEIVAEVLDEIDPEDDLALAVSLVERRWNSLESLDWQARSRRLYAYLGRRGFGAATIGAAIAQVEAARRAGLN